MLRTSRREDSGEVGQMHAPDRGAGAGKSEQVQNAISAVRAALSGLEPIQGLLQALERTLRRAKGSRRKPPAGARALQDRIEATAFAIDAVVQRMADDSATPGRSRPPLDFAGSVKECSFLATIRTGGAQSLEHASLADVHAIVEQAAARVQAQCRDLSAFLVEKLEPASTEAEIAAENHAAAIAAVDDSEFSTVAGRISGGELLLHVLNLRAEQRRESDAPPPVFRLVTGPGPGEVEPK
jgi:hypothetical protein